MLKNTRSRSALVATLLCAGVAVSAAGQATTEGERYHWAEGGVSVGLPAGWTVNDARADDAYVEVRAPDGTAICGFQTGAVRFASPSDLADFMTEFSARDVAKRGLEQVVLDRREVITPLGIAGIAVRVDILEGGRSQRVYYLRDGVAHVVDCECAVVDWDRHAADFRDIIESFDLD